METHVKVLNKELDRHKDYQKDAEDTVILVERAQELKQKVRKGDELEQALVSNLGRLTMLLELLNRDVDDNLKSESSRMSDRVWSRNSKSTMT